MQQLRLVWYHGTQDAHAVVKGRYPARDVVPVQIRMVGLIDAAGGHLCILFHLPECQPGLRKIASELLACKLGVRIQNSVSPQIPVKLTEVLVCIF